MDNIIKVVSVIIGTIIGAGFASGQEIKIFFSKYGSCGIIGILISITIMVLIINLCFRILLKNNVEKYNSFLGIIFRENTVIKESMKNITNLFMMSSFFIMSIGFSSCLEQHFLIPRFICGIFFSIICYIAFIGRINRIIKINQYIMPILISVIIFAGFKCIINENINLDINMDIRFILSSAIYASYNLLPIIPILVPLKVYIQDKKQINFITIMVLVSTSISALAIFFVTSVNHIYTSEILLIDISKRWGVYQGALFCIVILFAIFTSAICSGYGFAKNISINERRYRKIVLIMCLFVVPISNLNFSTTIQIIYPFFGVLGLVEIYYIVYYYLKQYFNYLEMK